jgi:hypothetical protein
MRRLLTALIGAVLFISTAASAFTAPPFPRLAALWIGNQTYQDASVQQDLARGSIAVINVFPGWDAGTGTTVQRVIQNIKAINPNTMVFQYINNGEISSDRTANASFASLYAKLDAMTWWLYENGGSGTIVNSVFPGAVAINDTLFVPPDANGDTWVTWYAKWAVQQYYVPSPALDGFYLDNVNWEPTVDGDYNRDGITDSATNPTTATWRRLGFRKHFDTMHQLMPGKFQVGNVADWGEAAAVFPELNQQLNGGLIEGIIGYSWSYETWGGWTTMMAAYRKVMAALTTPQLAMFAQIGSATDYQAFRYGLGSCLMDNGYYIFNTSGAYGDAPAFDEYNAKLGNSTTAPQTTAWQKGVYRRDFDNGIALVNPKGNGTQTVQLETSFKHLVGSQDPGVNNGQTVTSVTLQDRDGIILMRMTQKTIPEPPGNVTVTRNQMEQGPSRQSVEASPSPGA